MQRKPARNFGSAKVWTNLSVRVFSKRSDVPAKILSEQFSHIESESPDSLFFCYRNRWYNVSDFTKVDSEKYDGWRAYLHHKMSGVVICVLGDGASYIVGTFR
jgi:hypothetical protein